LVHKWEVEAWGEVAVAAASTPSVVAACQAVEDEVPHKDFLGDFLSNDKMTRRVENDFRTTPEKTFQRPRSQMSTMFPWQTPTQTTISICYASWGWDSYSHVSLFQLTCW
jgi:hypothetical protein